MFVCSAKRGDCDAIYKAVLAEEGAVDINVASSADGRTPLHAAAAEGHLEACLLLTEASGNPAQKDLLGLNPIHYAAKRGSAEVVGILLMQHRDLINAKAMGGRTALHFASANADHHEVRVFLHICLLHAFKRVPCFFCLESIFQVVELLLGMEADVNAVNVQSKTPLLVAAESGAEQSAALLIACGSDLDAVDAKYQCAPIHWAA